MKKNVKKALLTGSIICTFMFALAGCAKTTECDGCGAEKKCNEYVIKVDGDKESGWFCEDCADLMKSLVKFSGGSMKKKL